MMSMAGGVGNGRKVDQTPTRAVASVCAVIILISIFLEKGLHLIGQWFTEKNNKKPLFEALERIKSELMTLGFISLLLSFGTKYISQICIPEKAANVMLPCLLRNQTLAAVQDKHHRILSAAASTCHSGKVVLVSSEARHQIHTFIFFLAVFHVFHSATTMALGRAKIRRWKEWEKETTSSSYEFSSDPLRFRFAQDTSFVKQHLSFWNKIPMLFYIVSFFWQFFWSVRKADYLAMWHGFITVHLAPGSKFDFQKYIKWSLEDDFKVIVGISPTSWVSAVIFLLLNVYRWQGLFWVSIFPLIIISAVGTKLQSIITKMAIEIEDSHSVVQGIPPAHLSDNHFWFGHPHLILFLLHFTLFQNGFQMIHFLWIWYEFGLHSCFNENFKLVIARLCFGIGVQFLCSYVTLPLYALVSQMNSQMKKTIFDAQTVKTLMKWHQTARKKHAKSTSLDTSSHALHRYKTTGHSGRSVRSKHYYDHNISDTETEMVTSYSTSVLLHHISINSDLEIHIKDEEEDENSDKDDFSFARPALQN